MDSQPSLSLPEWLVLTLLGQQPMHGFAVARLTEPDGELGRVWRIPKAVIYRAIGRLEAAGLVVPRGMQPGLGPQRTVYAATPQGDRAARGWLHTPVRHVRDIRSHLLVKLALLDRVGDDPAGLLRRQREVLEPIAQAIEAGHDERSGFDAILLAWRRATVHAALDFLDSVSAATTPHGPDQPAGSTRTRILAAPPPPPVRQGPWTAGSG
jgi:DNA-binding PadR family transcriptional regulator